MLIEFVLCWQGNDYNPWIIYPLDPVANVAAKSFAARMHHGGSKVKSYYSSGSLSFVTPELWSFFAMYGELMSHPAYVDPIPPPTPPPVGSSLEAAVMSATKFGPHHWFSEHAATALFSSDWTTPLSHPTNSPICDGCDMDVSFTTRANSRLANFWSRLLVLATEELDIDGIYLGQSSSLLSSCSFSKHIAKTYPSPQSNMCLLLTRVF